MTVVAAEASSDAGHRSPAGPLERSFFHRPIDELAVALLGVRLVRRWPDSTLSKGRIVEVEAYGGPEDRASHARRGATRRNATMFGPPGHAYVYRVYGMHTCVNVVGGGFGAVLLRAAMPDGDPSALRARRDRPARAPLPLPRLASGPGNLGRAFGIDLDLDGADLTEGGSLWLEAGAGLGISIVCGPRIGVAYAGPGWAELPRRFGIRGHPALSRPFPVDA